MAKKVFISYAWEDDRFAEKVLNFSNKLRSKGIDANIDQYEENPDKVSEGKAFKMTRNQQERGE